MSRVRIVLCDTLRCYQPAVLSFESELRQGSGTIRLCEACAERTVHLLARLLTDYQIEREREEPKCASPSSSPATTTGARSTRSGSSK